MSDIYSKSARCFPNECYICRSRENLIRCECKMISYCSEDHRQQHLSIHKDFCKVVKELLKLKGITHIHEELIYIFGPEWSTRKQEIRKEIIKKLGRTLSPLELAMWSRPRICFVCHETKQADLNNCPHCPIATFCKEHKHDEFHDENCKLMNTYLKVLTTAEELNIDLDFLSSAFPFTGVGILFRGIDVLTLTYKPNNMEERCSKSRLLKKDLINFMDAASKINSALNKIHDTIPEKLTIHIDALSSEHAIIKKDYWEFLLHLNPQIKHLKIAITQTENRNDSKCLCKNCHSEGKELIIEYSSKSYDDYMLDENYLKPDILFYVQINDECNSERLNNWSEFNCPVILRFDTNLNFFKIQHFLLFKTEKFRSIYEGQIKAPFSTLSSIEHEDYFIILQSKENKVLENSCDTITDEICEETIAKNTTQSLLVVKDIDSENLNCAENIITDAAKTTQSESKDSTKFLPNEHQSASNSFIESNKIIIENENTNTDETELEKNSTNEKMENKSSNNLAEPAVHTPNAEEIKEQKSEDQRTISPSSSVCSFVIISEPGEEKEEKITENSKTEENEKFSKSVDNEFLAPNEDGGKNAEGDNTQKKNIEERNEEKEGNKKISLSCKSFENNDFRFSQSSYLLEHISYLRNEIEGLRQQLNLSVNEVTNLQTKLEKVSLDSHKKDEFIKKILCDIVDFADIKIEYTDSLSENNI
ncbi:uncharacterized protein LOC122507434 [Leptopilina heterotoma]|uniref:uncharacterized protein LOC122507434 n=1 Tax=Leptopilina heterotoma TaxID=63436 RepID=UPI001CA97336|nr:uncharacterized protein LOC122507434 [Leptopilina heterotoma]